MTITVDFTGVPTTGETPLTVNFTSSVVITPLPPPPEPPVTDTQETVDIPVEKLTADQYGSIMVKNTVSEFPMKFYDNGDYPLRTVSVWPIPVKCFNVRLWLWQPLINAVDLDTDIVFPKGYERALRFALAVELAAEFGKEVPQNVLNVAKMSKGTIKRLNSIPQVMVGSAAIASNKESMFNYVLGDTVSNGGQ